MLTLYHAPNSRSSAILTLLEEMGVADKVEIKVVNILRSDGTGARDASNPHPEGKVPALVHDGQLITERGAIMLHLTTLFPESGLAPAIGSPEWGRLLTWLSWYQGVMEPVLILEFAGVSHPFIPSTFRSHTEVAARIRAALEKGPWLLGDRFSAADILVHSPYAWFEGSAPDDALIQDWIARCKTRPARLARIAADAALLASLAA
jgi:glutathione S-transferase